MGAVVKVAKSDLSLVELMGNAYEQIDQYRSLLGQAQQSREEAALAIFRAGEWLSLARKKFKAEGRGKWTAFLKEYRIPRTTEWEARTLYKRAKTEGAVSGMTPTEAKRKFKVVPPKKKATSEPTVRLVKESRAMMNSSNGNGTSLPMTPRRPGEPPSDVSFGSGRVNASMAPARSNEPPPTPAVQTSEDVTKAAPAQSSSAERDVEPATTANEPPTPGEQHPLLTTIVQIVRRLEVLVEDIAKLDLTEEPKDDINREIDHGIAIFTKLKGEIAR